ncbi:two-component system, cell cycle sensor histidine kinase and response regulator CckA [Palleronia marisminoris]|uniref:histidine kinase n=1 Tax=Palleronia marisminoris TaxID=315423 RepID=A0A1Y5T9F8_9RHOB|nr:ATP-binding protein [Palleronia marisminoris]SFH24419.1 two-component system, cell cycle sensor histidine kinase and response regulator CckA [Palleronia marisminoris]SLN58805.1 Blue-light-activated protein [Palleronia marisminoris]
MSDIRLPLADEAARLGYRAAWLLVLAFAMALSAWVVPATNYAVPLAAAAATLAAVALCVLVIGGPASMRRRRRAEVLRDLFGNDRRPAYVTDSAGRLVWSNDAGDLDRLLASDLADPSEVVADLRARALAEGSAERRLARTPPRRLTVQQVVGGDLLWRLDDAPAAETEASPVDFEALPLPLIEIDRDGMIVSANLRARGVLKIGEGERVGLHEIVDGLGRSVPKWVFDAFAGLGLARPEVVRASRRTEDMFIQIVLDRAPGSGSNRLMAVMHDATHLKTLEAQMVQSQKMQAIGQLAGGVAHDFNNLLTAIRGHCDLLLLRRDASDPDFADLEQINQNANRAASLVGQLLAFSRKQNLKLESVALRDLLSDLTHLLDRLVGARVTLALNHAPDLPLVRADRRQLEQVIMNLVVNARDAMPNGGRIDISTRSVHLERPLTRDRATVPIGDYVEVSVVDEGTGIPPDVRKKIFEPFFTTKKTGEGTGLGLSTAYGIVKQIGGYIFVDSREGQGTTFTLLFPADAVPLLPVPEAPRPEQAAKDADGAVILLVEDEAPVRAFATRALRLRGYEVIEAEDGESALEIVSDDSVSIDLFVSDVIMPGMDGPTWVRHARERRPDVPVVFMSGYAEESFSGTQALIARSAFIQKPFSLSDLTTIVARQFEMENEPSADG